MNPTIQDNQIKQKLSEKLKNLFTLSLLAVSKVSLVPATALGKNHQPPPGLFDDSAIQQSTMMNTFLCELFPRFLLAGLTLFLFSSNLFAGGVNLSWNAPTTGTTPAGYKAFYGTSSGTYGSSVDVGNVTTSTIPNLTAGTTYYFALKSFDATGNQSTYSNEVSATVPATGSLTVDFTANPNSPLTMNQLVTFTPAVTPSTATISSWSWDFGNGTSSTGQKPTISYGSAGAYTVKLTAQDSTGLSATTTKTNMITVLAPPVAGFTSSASALTASFTDTSTGSITSWSWNFGESSSSTNTSTLLNPLHTYSAAGTYTVALTVTGSSGTNTKTGSINVSVPSSGGTGNGTTVNGLVAAYGFEENSGTTVADASGQGNHGTITNAVRITTGHSGNALQFNGTNAWVTVKNSAALALSTGMTLEAWVYPTSLSTGGKTVLLKEGSGKEVYSLYAKEDTAVPISYLNDGSYISVSGPKQLPMNQWSHLVATYDGQYQRIYVGGIEVANSKQSGLIQSSTGVLRIGGNSLWGEYFQGYIDEVRIYNRALKISPINEVTSNLANAVSVTNPPQFVMGDKTLETWIDYKPQGTAEAFQTIPAKSGVVTTVQLYLDASSTATKVVAGIYQNNNGHPGALVAQGILSTPKPGAWNSVSIPVATVTAGQPYWIAILGSKGQIGFRDLVGSGTGLMETSASSSLTSLPSTWTGSVSKTNAAMSVYGNGY